MALEKVKGYLASDGKYFPDHAHSDAVNYELELEFKQWCSDNICRGGEWDSLMVARAILESWFVSKKVPV